MRAKSFKSARTLCGDDGNTTTTYWRSVQLVYDHKSKQSIAKPVLEKLLNENSKFEDYIKWVIENNILQKKFEGRVWDLNDPFARLSLGPDTKHKYGINTEYFILCKKNGQTINDVYLAEKASFSFDELSVGHLLGSMILHPICWIVGLGWEKVSGIKQRRSDFTVSYIRATKLGDNERYTIEQIPDLPGDCNDYFC